MRKAFDLVPTSRRLQSHLRNFAAAAEEQKLSDVAVAAGVPSPSPSRKVVIFSPARTASQQGIANTAEGKQESQKIQVTRCPATYLSPYNLQVVGQLGK